MKMGNFWVEYKAQFFLGKGKGIQNFGAFYCSIPAKAKFFTILVLFTWRKAYARSDKGRGF